MGFDRQLSQIPAPAGISSGRESQWWPRSSNFFPQGDSTLLLSPAMPPPPPPISSRHAASDSWSTGFGYSRASHLQPNGTEAMPFYRVNGDLAQDWPGPIHRGSQSSNGSTNSRNFASASFQSYASSMDQDAVSRVPIAEIASDYKQNAHMQLDTTLPVISAYHCSSSNPAREE